MPASLVHLVAVRTPGGAGGGPRFVEIRPGPADAVGALYAQNARLPRPRGGADETGGQTFPALWGSRAFNIGAGMARLDTAAAFVKAKMPLGGVTLSDQEAYDVAAFFTLQPRPDFKAKKGDWPHGGKPADARY
jgi:thiosulfate dehydrogenase